MCTIKQRNNANGFTLIEVAITMVIMGVIIASSATAFVQWQKFQRVQTTQTNVQAAQTAIEGFLQQNGRYPCPAPLDAVRANTATYGVEPPAANDCTNMAALGPMGFGAVFVTPKLNAVINYQNPNTGAVINGNPNIRIGTIPFRNLGLNETQAYDGYRNRLFYAVTEHLASQISFDPATGGISVQDNATTSLVNPADSAHFIVFSAGENGLGAYTREGVQIACPGAAALENENCNMDALFRVDQYSSANNNNALDDVIAYGSVLPPRWTRPNVGNLNTARAAEDNVGLGVGTGGDPQEELDVTGTMNLRDDPLTPEIEGRLRAELLCDHNNPTDPNCFNISAITGLTADGEGMECTNPNEFIVAIENNAPVCDVVTVGCEAPGEIILGVRANGDIDCGTAPAACPSVNVNICGIPDLLTGAPDGTTDTASITTTSGGIRSRNFRCQNGGWIPQGGEFGNPCNCTPETIFTQTNLSCVDTGYNCGDRFTGTYDRTRERICPSGATPTTRFNDNCSCIESEQPNNGSCSSWRVSRLPAPDRPSTGESFNTGNINLVRRHLCPQETCTGWEHVSNDCGCVDEAPFIETRACTNGFPANEILTRQFICTGGEGAGQSGRIQTTNVDDSACTCTGSVTGTPRDCSTLTPALLNRAGFSGVETTVTFAPDGFGACIRTTTDNGPISDYCENPPPRICNWTPVPGAPIQGPAVARSGQCDCDTFAGIERTCRAGPTTHHTRCTCN